MNNPTADDATSFRPLTRADAPELLRLWNRSSPYDPCSASLLDEKIWQDPDYHSDMAIACTSANKLVGFVVAISRHPGAATDLAGFIKLLAVDRGFQRSGLGSRLLLEAERSLARAGVRTVRLGESAPNYLTPGVDLRYRGALAFFTHHGYEPIAHACNMRVTLAGRSFGTAGSQRRLEDRGITVRRATEHDWSALEGLLREFGGTWSAEVERSLGHEPPLVHIARRGGALLGFSASEGNNVGTGWFGPMGTTEQARGLGIGQVLLFRCLADLAALDFPEVIIPWVGPVDFYARHAGAEIDRRFQRFEKELDT